MTPTIPPAKHDVDPSRSLPNASAGSTSPVQPPALETDETRCNCFPTPDDPHHATSCPASALFNAQTPLSVLTSAALAHAEYGGVPEEDAAKIRAAVRALAVLSAPAPEGVETQLETAQRIVREHYAALEAAFKAQGALPWRDVRLLLDVARILAAPRSGDGVETKAPTEQPSKVRTCNRHDDCDAANAKAMAAGRSTIGIHCHDDDCEDCFGC
jgi:hypothetical protein